MQRITNCILHDPARDQILLLQKPSRGWWVAPGGKMEPYETITESVVREYREETGLIVQNPELRGIFTIVVEEEQQIKDEWMMFTFYAQQYSGELLTHSPEGLLKWQNPEDIAKLPKAEGDQLYFDHILRSPDIFIKRFRYTPEYNLISVE
ncbi:8-oxo-dGTP diphosphatase [Bacillus horti]|uniref:8-oxo-dGTP diphosphatase n=1 Tax=Caldalkalibacillus horti TaxID=77523 RepID=A0ABT9W441_9BACI|nr:8-oxo-dGTP diphosphatase [Bacillus horti]MDQ0168011.1 8-oxo-dGTP diphosphatase [Bacillus horti]